MGDEVELWRHAADEADLTSKEINLVVDACESDEDLRAELSWLLRTLSAELSGPFLRSLVAELDARAVRVRVGDCVMPALVNTVIGREGELI